MARETRGSAHAPAASDVPASDSPAVPKRKRQSSTSVHTETNAPRPISLKVTLPAQSGAQGGPKVRLNVSPNKVDPEPVATGGAKRQRISLKVKGGKKKAKGANGDMPNGDGDAEAKDPNGTVEDEDSAMVDDDAEDDVDVKGEETVEVQKKVVRILSEEVRDALAVVLSRMAANLPRPLNGVLKLFLPPSFSEKEENTLAYILKQSDLSWERLVELLHTFATHLLQPCAYPCPFPPLSHIHTSIPPLPPHQPPHVIYDFCSSMRDLILSIEPQSDTEIFLAKVEKWGLMMRVPGGSEGRGAGEWWTGIADWREAEKMKSTDAWVKEENDEGVLERLAADGNKFGYANAVSIASFAGTASGQATAPKLGDCLVRKASLKAQRWKEQLARRKGGFGSVQRPVTIPRVTTLPWTPAFAPTYDSNYASGGVGYWATLEAMHQRNRYRPWTGARKTAVEAEDGAGYWGCLEVDKKDKAMIVEHDDAGTVDDGASSDLLEKVDGQKNGRERTADDVLKDNAEWLNELLGWQEVRVRRGNKVASERENVLAEELLNSLSTLSSTLPPSSLIPGLQPGFAHTASRRLIQTPGPVVRGTLDPRRPRAIHDSTTIRPRPSTGMSMPPIPSSGSMSNPPSIAQQLAGGSGRSTASYVAGGYAGTPTPSYNPQNQARSSNYGYQSSSVNGASRSGYPSTDHRQTTPASGSTRSSYSHTPFFPGSTNLPPQSGNTIYSRSGGQQASSSQVMMSPSVLGGGGSPSPTIGVGYGQGTGQGRPGMMPSGLRQSFGPETSSAPRSGTGSPAVHGLQGSGGYFSGIAGINRG